MTKIKPIKASLNFKKESAGNVVARATAVLGGIFVAKDDYVTPPIAQAAFQSEIDALSAAAYVMNWRLVFEHESYFQSFGRPSLLQHLWSLAVEEQFYLAWPPLFAIGVRWLRPGSSPPTSTPSRHTALARHWATRSRPRRCWPPTAASATAGPFGSGRSSRT